jgi:hypothetical protein
VPVRTRLWLAIVCGFITGGVTAQKNYLFAYPRDFGQVWFAARSILHGINPYPLVGPGLTYEWPWPLLYPIPAAIVAVPFVPFSLPWASVAFMAVGGACFGWALMEYGYGPLFGFFGAPLHYAAEVGQWSPLFAAAVIVAPLQMLLLAKPTIGAAMFAARPTWWAAGGTLILALLAFVIQPTWVQDWIHAVRSNNAAWSPYRPYQIPVTMAGGWLAILCLLRWRRPEARLVAALACVPQTPILYEAVPLFLVPRTFWQAATLVALSYGQHEVAQWLMPEPRIQGEYMILSGRLIVLLLYIPATAMVVGRPNEGRVPTWLERRIHGWPGWLRGRSPIAV